MAHQPNILSYVGYYYTDAAGNNLWNGSITIPQYLKFESTNLVNNMFDNTKLAIFSNVQSDTQRLNHIFIPPPII